MLYSYYEQTGSLLLKSSCNFVIQEGQIPHITVPGITLLMRQTANCVWKDFIYVVAMWRQVRGYPQKGQTTYTNANTARKVRLLYNFRIQQFVNLFGKRKRTQYPNLVLAEYNNRLWFFTWIAEWTEASRFVRRLCKHNKKMTPFSPLLLAKSQTNGYTRVGRAAKLGKAKKITKVFTIGVPVFFSRYIYYDVLPRGFAYRLSILNIDESKARLKNK